MCVFLINSLSSPTGENLRKNVKWVIYPILNPDGYKYTWTDDRLWRKNRRDHAQAYDYCNGVAQG